MKECLDVVVVVYFFVTGMYVFHEFQSLCCVIRDMYEIQSNGILGFGIRFFRCSCDVLLLSKSLNLLKQLFRTAEFIWKMCCILKLGDIYIALPSVCPLPKATQTGDFIFF